MNAAQVLRRMALGFIANCSNESGREVWRIEDADGNMAAVGSSITVLKDRGHAWTHRPSRGGSAGITDEGKAAARARGWEVRS